MSCAPARILGVPGGRLAAGDPADITVVDPDRRFVFSAAECRSKGRNTPFDGRQFRGKAVLTIMNGRVTFTDL